MKRLLLPFLLLLAIGVSAQDKPDTTALFDLAIELNDSAKDMAPHDTAFLNRQIKAYDYITAAVKAGKHDTAFEQAIICRDLGRAYAYSRKAELSKIYYAQAAKHFKVAAAIEKETVMRNNLHDEAQDCTAKAGLPLE